MTEKGWYILVTFSYNVASTSDRRIMGVNALEPKTFHAIDENLCDVFGICPSSGFPKITSLNPYVQLAVEEELLLPAAKPDIEQVVSCHISAVITKTKCIPTPVGPKLIVKGLIKQKVMYVAKLPEQSVHAAHFEKPFCTFLELPEFFENDNGKRERLTSEQIGLTQVLIEDCIVQAHDSRTIDKCVVLFIWTTLQ